jgi:hypothetical protein
MLKEVYEMSVKVATKYQMNEYKKSIKVFYLVVILVMAFFRIITSISKVSDFTSTGGVEGSAMIFLFILGLNSFKETFLMMLQNGTTRKSMFIGRIITILATSVFMAVVDRFIVNIGGLLNDMRDNYYINGMYEMIFDKRSKSLHIVTKNLEAILITAGVYMAAMVAGYIITTAYYRMSKPWKIAVSIGVPASLMILLPILDEVAFGGKVSIALGRIFAFVFGGKTGNPYNLLLSCLVFALVALGLTWLLVRKAVEKN